MDVVKPVKSSSPSSARAVPESAQSSQYLSFSLGGEEFAVDILYVREIRGIGTITPLPNAPAHLQGVMNLRGLTVPVVDLRQLIGLPPAERGPFSVIIVLAGRGRARGFIVDAVCDVISATPADIEPTSELGVGMVAGLVCGVTRIGERFVALLDVARLTACGGAEGFGP